jgi:hypothetical protein
MRIIVTGNAFAMGPLITALIAAMFQPHDQPRHVTRYRLFRACGASKVRAAWWTVR